MIEKLGVDPDWQTAHPGNVTQISQNELHLWWLPLTLNQDQQTTALSLLSDIQRDKYHRRATPELKEAYLAGRYYLLSLLAGYSGSTASEIKLSYSRLNKPSLSHSDKHIEFNFTDTSSHGNTHGLFALTVGRSIGVDLESRARRSQFKPIVEKRFTPAETKFVTDGNTNEIDPERFLAIWTRKEAFGKATGQGINFRMNQRDLASASHTLNFFDDDNQAWRLTQIMLGRDLISCVVHAEHTKLKLKAFCLADD